MRPGRSRTRRTGWSVRCRSTRSTPVRRALRSATGSRRGRGVATRAVRAATGLAFGRLGLHRLYLYHAVDNRGSCSIASAAGFRHEGTLRQSYRYAGGAYHNEHLRALLAAEATS